MSAPLDPVIHAPPRLQIMAMLTTVSEAEFAYIRDHLEISDSVLSKHASTLETAGYIHIRKGQVGRRPKTWLRLTPRGRTAFSTYVTTLQTIIQPSPARTRPS